MRSVGDRMADQQVTYRGGGFSGGVSYPAGMSDVLVARLARMEVEEQWEVAEVQRVRAELAEDWRQRSIVAAAVLAEQRGEFVTPRDCGGSSSTGTMRPSIRR